MKKHNAHPDIVRAIVEGLRKAGLTVADAAPSAQIN
jgi:hypothetical protein